MRVSLLRWNDRDKQWQGLTAIFKPDKNAYLFVDPATGLQYRVEIIDADR